MSIYETSISNFKKQLEFYKNLAEQLQQENAKLKKELEKENKQIEKMLEYINDELPYLYRNNKNCKRLGEIMQLENVLALLEDEGDDKE